jgi:hypothetical protein
VPNDFAFDEIQGILGNVCGLVGNPFQVSGNDQVADQAVNPVGMLLDLFDNQTVGFVVHLIDLVIEADNLPGQVRIEIDQ